MPLPRIAHRVRRPSLADSPQNLQSYELIFRSRDPKVSEFCPKSLTERNAHRAKMLLNEHLNDLRSCERAAQCRSPIISECCHSYPIARVSRWARTLPRSRPVD